MGGIDPVVAGILAECNCNAGHPIQWPDPTTWLATPALTRDSTNVANDRVFLLGDAIGYVEPFTGEGMSWALASAEAVIPIVVEIVKSSWQNQFADRWNDWAYKQRINNQKTCRWIANRIRRPRGAAWVLRACNWIPPLRAAIIRKASQ